MSFLISRSIALAFVWVFLLGGIQSFRSVVGIVTGEMAYAQGFGAGRSRDSLFRGGESRDRSRGRSNRREELPPPEYDQQPEPPPQQQESEQPEQRPAPPPPSQPQVSPVVPRRPPGVKPPVRRPPPGKPPTQPGEKPEEPKVGIPPEGHIVFRLAPLEQSAVIGEEFVAHVWIDNPEEKEFNVVSLALSYDPSLLDFVDAPGGVEGIPNCYDLSDKTTSAFKLVRDSLEDPFYLNRADTKNGMIYYRARSASGEVCKGEGFLLSMKFKALAPIHRTGLRFQFAEWSEELSPPLQSDQDWTWPKTMTFLGLAGRDKGWENRLGGASNRDGVISALVSLVGPDKETLLEAQESVPEGLTRTRFVLDPPFVAAQVGQTFDVGVHLENPDRIPWDRVRLDIRFDPRFLEVVDQDEGNWLTLGANILDGPYHDRFPFEFPRDNQVRADSGRILYDAAVFRESLYSAGLLATIRFRAKMDVPETRILFAFPRDLDDRRGTSLLLRGSDVLGDTEIHQDGADGAVAVVVPAKDRSFVSAKTDDELGPSNEKR